MASSRMHWTAYLWPGLPGLWLRGSWAGLVVAVGFTSLANVLLLATLVYREWISVDALWVGYGALAVVWLLAWWQSRWERRAVLAGGSDDPIALSPKAEKKRNRQEELFREAQRRYLENDWVAAEQLLLKLLKADSRDVEGRLLLATMWRHQQRYQEAQRQLDRLARLEAAQTWQREIAAERRRLEQALALPEPAENETIATDSDTTDGKETSKEEDKTDDSSDRRLAA